MELCCSSPRLNLKFFIGPGEKYHGPLRRVFTILKKQHATINPEVLLCFAIKVLHDTTGSERYVPFLLALGILPIFPILGKDLPSKKDKMQALINAREAVAEIHAEQRISKLIRSNVPPSAQY